MTTAHERFEKKIEKTETCWNWVGGISGTGYGNFWLLGKSISAHKFAYLMFKGNIKKGLQIDHLCKNRKCVNPEHLEVVTCRENLMRGNGFNRVNAEKTHCPAGHAYDEQNTYYNVVKSGFLRVCRKCRALRENKRRKAKKESVG